MTSLSEHRISFSGQQITLIQNCLREIRFGASAAEMSRVFGHDKDRLSQLIDIFSAPVLVQPVLLPKEKLRAIYDLIHAAIYCLGKFELQTLTGATLEAAVDTNLLIASKLWGAYGGSRFSCQ
jgi:hypothetical protein